MNDKKQNGVIRILSKNSTVSVSLLIVVVMVSVFIVRIQALAESNEMEIGRHVDSPVLHEGLRAHVEGEFVRKDSFNDLERDVERVEKKLDALLNNFGVPAP